ncbi:hypothetical protein TOPH_03289 [Tolypocladium ophioglossoides CBS 100239]|uniref:Aminoglycoside phosphotransferase domain-containing protein n=1 Tax=Tolypocladium ophioglossoides (strain CBS 100239) TaxID=1163406 RepID=A0A0L0ND07_TOLOC|nr:hypothetical protein TOPH_03289 [Tolypocladium ophioglossoides CBS 100239]
MSSTSDAPRKRRPSERWTSFDDWNYDGMKERLEGFMASINKKSLTAHAEAVLNSPLSMSDAFSAGQYWCCFELVAPDSRLIIARVRLPKHPNSSASDADEEYLIQCEAATMKFVQANVATIPVPTLYACEMPGSPRAAEAGAAYILIEGFYGNAVQDINHSIYDLPNSTQERLIAQWTSFQAELAAFTFPRIGSISQFSPDTGATVGKLATASADSLAIAGPFQSGRDYLVAVAEARLNQELHRKNSDSETDDFTALGFLVFRNIVRDTNIFKGDQGPFHFNHMDMGIQNILVDDDFNIIAVIDWEFAQSAPWEVICYPMPISIINSDEEIKEILGNPGHIGHRNVSRQAATRGLYRQKFKEAESALMARGRPLRVSIAETLEGKASRIYGLAEKLGIFKGMAEDLTYEMLRLGHGLTGLEAKRHLEKVKAEANGAFDTSMSH